MRITAGAPHMADAVARQRLNSRRIRGACESLAPHPTASIWSAPKASGLDRRAQPHSSRPRPTEQRHAHAHTHGHSGCGVGRPVVRRKRPSRAASENRRVWGHRRVGRAHRRHQGLIGGHSRIAAAPGPRSNAMHTPTPTGIAVAALVGLLCAGSGPREPHQKNGVFGGTGESAEPA